MIRFIQLLMPALSGSDSHYRGRDVSRRAIQNALGVGHQLACVQFVLLMFLISSFLLLCSKNYMVVCDG